VTARLPVERLFKVGPSPAVQRQPSTWLFGNPEVGQRWRFWEVSRGDRRSETTRGGEDYTLRPLLSLKGLAETLVSARGITPLPFYWYIHDPVPLTADCKLTFIMNSLHRKPACAVSPWSLGTGSRRQHVPRDQEEHL